MPKGWELTRIKEVASVITGTTPSTKDPDNYGDEYFFVSPGDLGNGKYVNATEKKLSVKGFRQSRSIRKGSTLFTCIGSTIGKVGVAGQELATNQQINAVICDRDKADDEYVYYALDSRAPKIKLLAGTQAVPIINKSTFENQELLLPPLPEQRKIAEILGPWDEAIALVEQRIEAARQRKKGLMQRLLTGRVRFPEFEGEEWRESQLGEFFQEFTKRNRGNKDLTVLSCSTIHGIVPQTQVFSRRIASENTERYKVVERGDLVYDPMLLWDASIGFLEAVERGVVSPAYSTFKFRKENEVREYFKYLIKMHYLTEQYKFISQGTNVRRRKAPIAAFLKLKVKVPCTMAEQRRITAVLQTCDREIELLTQKSDALQRQKKGLMQRLLTGRVRVRV